MAPALLLQLCVWMQHAYDEMREQITTLSFQVDAFEHEVCIQHNPMPSHAQQLQLVSFEW